METLVAVTILVIGVLGPLAMAARGISDGRFAQNQLVANMLAQEAMETIINYRNGNILDGNPAFNLISGDGALSTVTTASINGADDTVNLNGCTTDLEVDGDTSEPDGCLLVYDGGLGYYKNETSGNGQFARRIVLAKISDDELKVAVKITWKNKDVGKRLDIVEYLYAE
jgi:hypothetical protein